MKGDIEGWIEKSHDELLTITTNEMKGSLEPIPFTKANLIKMREAKSRLLGKEMLINAFKEKEQQHRQGKK